MRLNPTGRSRNLQDRRGARAGGLGIIGILLAFGLAWCTGTNPLAMLGLVNQVEQAMPVGQNASPVTDPEEEPLVLFVGAVLDSTQAFWRQYFAARGGTYQDAVLVLFRDRVQSACGMASSATGPFYCPGDQKVYIDLGFYDELRQQFQAPGDFAQAYVLAHEIGHHVQTLLGTEAQVREAQRARPGQQNVIQVAMELQADCYAGMWGHRAQQQGILEPGDIEEGLTAAAAIGDDRIQRQTTGVVQPESFTHGTSEQRMEWLQRGLRGGELEGCDTFGG